MLPGGRGASAAVHDRLIHCEEKRPAVCSSLAVPAAEGASVAVGPGYCQQRRLMARKPLGGWCLDGCPGQTVRGLD